jgi:hypothetical protein
VEDFSLCAGQDTITLQAKAGAGLVYEWYENATGGTPISLTNTLFVPSISTKNDYYLQYKQITGDSITFTYSAGQIESSGLLTSTITSASPCPGVMNIPMPAGAVVTGVNLSYQVTAQGGAWMSEQLSTLRCPTFNTAETQIFAGTGGFSGGTETYTRTTTIANGQLTGDTLKLELHVGRTWPDGGAGPCNTTYQFVPNNTWTVTVYYEGQACSNVRTPVVVIPSDTPTAAFTYITTPNYSVEYNFTNTSLNTDSVYWDFAGLGNSSLDNPTFLFASNGKFQVCMTAFNECGSNTFCDSVTVNNVGIVEVYDVDRLKVFPNPNTGKFEITFNDDLATLTLRLMDARGRMIQVDKLESSNGEFRHSYDISRMAKGVYLVQATTARGIVTQRVVVQ